MAKKKDWYWEAESDKIASDEDLRLLQSPEGWPGDGLECIGLWFLMINLMWRSSRSGYLHDPTNERLPLDSTKLAKLLGRDPTVVARVLTVLLDRGLFSKSPEGIIYSRGILRRVKLRKDRSKAGKKGGLRSQSLLKQTVEQKDEQTVRIGIGIQTQIPLNGSEAISLAQKVSFLQRKGHKVDWMNEWESNISDLLTNGVSVAEIDKDFDKTKGPNGTLKSETPWAFKERLLRERGKTSRPNGKPTMADSMNSYAEWSKEGTNDQR